MSTAPGPVRPVTPRHHRPHGLVLDAGHTGGQLPLPLGESVPRVGLVPDGAPPEAAFAKAGRR
ncbi:hypothetical protein [Streptomyces sp. NPDC006691]|uniref:hypothetical protein n=1 Tax=Streptomyces sp. NPDC006691 TaxID=3364757 RepID=UPI0036A8C587